jgi:hypothetical protein
MSLLLPVFETADTAKEVKPTFSLMLCEENAMQLGRSKVSDAT